jgi:hypothetical protein
MEVTLDSTLGVILDNPQARAVLDQYLPGVSTNPVAQMAKGMSLRMILSMPQAKQLGLTPQLAEQILAEINKQI